MPSKAIKRSSRPLPERHNPLLEPEHTPSLEILIERRRLGQTKLDVSSVHLNKINATSPSNLGVFDYAHLRVPLPKDLDDSGVFDANKYASYPESYFLMRRSSDGYVSATGMFKAAFPWASKEEEVEERDYHHTLPSSGPEEVAGNVWLSPEESIQLAEDYSMRPWIEALLDDRPIEKGAKDAAVNISTPPKFKIPERDDTFPVPQLSASTARRRVTRSSSPGKAASATPGRKIASPRKRRTKVAKADETPARPASSNLSLENGATASSVEPTSSVVSEESKDNLIRVDVTETEEKVNGEPVKILTNTKIVMPAGHPDLELPTTTEGVLEKAHEIAETARKLQSEKVKSLKRKADDLDDDEEVDEEAAQLVVQPVKKQKVLEDQLKKERVKARALIGITATLAIGAMVPYFL